MTRTALITGGTSGIGLTIAKELAKNGFQLALNGLEANGTEIAKDLADTYNTKVWFSNANLLDSNAVKSLAEAAQAALGTIDTLVNNAGIQFVSPIDEFPEEKWDAIQAINLKAPYLLCKALWPAMKAKQFGRIINIASAHGLVASENKSAYVASKHALIGLTKTLGLEGAPYNITCNAICPGYVYTPIVEKQIPEQMSIHNMSKEEIIQKVLLAKQAVKEFIPAQLIAEACLLFASESSRGLTGTALPIDGGWSAA